MVDLKIKNSDLKITDRKTIDSFKRSWQTNAVEVRQTKLKEAKERIQNVISWKRPVLIKKNLHYSMSSCFQIRAVIEKEGRGYIAETSTAKIEFLLSDVEFISLDGSEIEVK